MFSRISCPPIRQTLFLVCTSLLVLISWGLLTPDPLAVVKRSPFSVLTTISDLVMHFGVYFVFSLTCGLLFVNTPGSRPRTIVVSLLVVHAISMELLQIYIPCRTCDALDGLANLAGIFSGMAAVDWLAVIRLRRSEAAG